LSLTRGGVSAVAYENALVLTDRASEPDDASGAAPFVGGPARASREQRTNKFRGHSADKAPEFFA